METCAWLEAEVLLKRACVGVGYGHIAGLHRDKFFVGFKVVVAGQHPSTNKFLLKDSNEIKEIFGRVIADVIYLVWRDRKTVLTILLLWCVLHDTNYTFYDVVNECEVTLTIAIIEYLDGFAFHQFVCKTKVRHIWATGRTIDCEETEACGWDIVELAVGVCHELVALLGGCIE